MKRKDKIAADRFLENRGEPGFAAAEYSAVEESVFRRLSEPVSRTAKINDSRRSFVVQFAAAAALALLTFGSVTLFHSAEPAQRFRGRGVYAPELFAVRLAGPGEPSIRKIGRPALVRSDEFIQLMAPQIPDCKYASVFTVDENLSPNFYFESPAGFLLSETEPVYSPGSIDLATFKSPGKIRLFFLCDNRRIDNGEVADRLAELAEAGESFDRLDHFNPGAEYSASRLLLLKPPPAGAGKARDNLPGGDE